MFHWPEHQLLVYSLIVYALHIGAWWKQRGTSHAYRYYTMTILLFEYYSGYIIKSGITLVMNIEEVQLQCMQIILADIATILRYWPICCKDIKHQYHKSGHLRYIYSPVVHSATSHTMTVECSVIKCNKILNDYTSFLQS